MTAQLETMDLVSALETFGDRYHAVDVFADDLSEAARQDVGKSLVLLAGRSYRFRVFPQHGVVRLERLPTPGADEVAGAAMAGAVIGGAVAAASQKRGEGVLGGALLGLLVGGMLGTAIGSKPPARRVFAMELDPRTREWVAYDGGLLRWMKSQLLPPESGAQGAA